MRPWPGHAERRQSRQGKVLGDNSPVYICVLAEALTLALADRDAVYGARSSSPYAGTPRPSSLPFSRNNSTPTRLQTAVR